MSTGFRLFLLMVLSFGAIWVYQQRSEDLLCWLRAPRRLEELTQREEPFRSPVDTLDGLELYDVSYRGPESLVEPGPEEEEPPSSWRPSGLRPSLWANPGPAEWESGEVGTEGAERFPELLPFGGENLGDASRDVGVIEDPRTRAQEPLLVPFPEPPEDAESHLLPPPVAEPKDPASVPTVYEVKKGDSLCKIASTRLGDENRYREILKLNEDLLKGSTLLQPGMKLFLPPVDAPSSP